jgi:predicted amidohydrolase YtcJ
MRTRKRGGECRHLGSPYNPDTVVLTLDDDNTRATALVVRGERIVAVGTRGLLDAYDAPRIIDLEGRTVMPGFVDSHVHVSGWPERHIDLTSARSIADIAALVAERARMLGPGEWITGYGWSEDQLEDGRRPLGADLDAAAPDNPVVLTRAGAHSAVASSRALTLAGIDASTPDPEGGAIERDASGTPTGIIRERQDLVTRLVPSASDAELRPSLIDNLRGLLAHGITSIIQAADTVEHFTEWERVYAQHRGSLPRASVQVAWEGVDTMAAFGRTSGDGDEHLRVGAVKLFVDGGFTGPAAYTREPYRDMGDYRGKLTLPPTAIYQVVREAHRGGWQLGIHAIGDAAIELAAEALASVLTETPRPDHRHYLNHFTLMPGTVTMARMAEHGIAITQQPNFTYTLEGRYVTYSDILPVGPMLGLYAAVTRKGRSGTVFGPGERLSMAEALRAYTVGGAWLTREEAAKGTLEPGKLADFIVLSSSPLDVHDDDILTIQVLETWLGGRQVYVRSTQENTP